MVSRGAHRVPAGHARRVWFFDLDDTLHDSSHAIHGAIDRRMTEFVARQLGVDAARADYLRRHYWHRYGATLLGLVRHHGVDAARFLQETHDIELHPLLRTERGLALSLARLPGRKILLTNAPAHYAGRVLAGIGLHRRFRQRYAIESMRVHGHLRPKPSRSMLRHLLAREGLASRSQAGRAVLVEDNLGNLRAARAVGMKTVLVQVHRRRREPGRLRGQAYVDARIHAIRDLGRTRLAAGRQPVR